MTYQFCQCKDDSVFDGQYFIEKIRGEYQRTDRADINYVIKHFKTTRGLRDVSSWDENTKVPKHCYVVLCQFNRLDELLESYPELFL